jgi:hypothetical protein
LLLLLLWLLCVVLLQTKALVGGLHEGPRRLLLKVLLLPLLLRLL